LRALGKGSKRDKRSGRQVSCVLWWLPRQCGVPGWGGRGDGGGNTLIRLAVCAHPPSLFAAAG
jgi:hypothetical protein